MKYLRLGLVGVSCFTMLAISTMAPTEASTIKFPSLDLSSYKGTKELNNNASVSYTYGLSYNDGGSGDIWYIQLMFNQSVYGDYFAGCKGLYITNLYSSTESSALLGLNQAITQSGTTYTNFIQYYTSQMRFIDVFGTSTTANRSNCFYFPLNTSTFITPYYPINLRLYGRSVYDVPTIQHIASTLISNISVYNEAVVMRSGYQTDDLTSMYQQGYDEAYKDLQNQISTSYDNGYTSGYNVGINQSLDDIGILDFIPKMAVVPLTYLERLNDFNIFGFTLLNLFELVATVGLFKVVLKVVF